MSKRRETAAEAWERMRNGSPQATSARPAQQSWTPPPAPPPAPPRRGESSNGHSRTDAEEASASELVHRLTDQTKTLVRQEMRLAQAELKEKGKKAGIGAGLFGAGGLAGMFGAAVLIAAAVLALSTAIAAWLSALIVALVLLTAAGVAALMGKKQIEQAIPPAPEQAVGSVKRDVDTVKQSAKR